MRPERGRLLRSLLRRTESTHVRVGALDDIVPGRIRAVAGHPIVVTRLGETVHAFEAQCPHAGARLVKGKIVEGCLECPLHGARFDLARGTVVQGPARRRLRVFPVEVRDGDVYVVLRPRGGWRW